MLYPRIKRDGSTSDDMYTLVTGEPGRDDGIKVPARSISSIMATLGHRPGSVFYQNLIESTDSL
jgi:hypothetical protein